MDSTEKHLSIEIVHYSENNKVSLQDTLYKIFNCSENDARLIVNDQFRFQEVGCNNKIKPLKKKKKSSNACSFLFA